MRKLPRYNEYFVLSLAVGKNDMMIQMGDKPNTTPIGQDRETWPQDFSKIESGPNYTTAAHAFVKATLRLVLWAPFVARNKVKTNAGKQSVSYMSIDIWKDLPSPLKDLSVFVSVSEV